MASAEYKIAVFGANGVGKSAITIQFVQNHFPDWIDPTVEEYYRKFMVIDGDDVKLSILDTKNPSDYSAYQNRPIPSTKGFLLVYSVTSMGTLDEIIEFKDKICRIKDSDRVPMVLVANKVDLERTREVTREEGERIALVWGVPYVEVSAKDRINIEEAFCILVREVMLERKELAAQSAKSTKLSGSKCTIS
jgi:GTPase KRas protein